MTRKLCPICHVEHEICKCGLPIWRNPRTGRILEAHGNGKHYCPEKGLDWKDPIKKAVKHIQTITKEQPTKKPDGKGGINL